MNTELPENILAFRYYEWAKYTAERDPAPFKVLAKAKLCPKYEKLGRIWLDWARTFVSISAGGTKELNKLLESLASEPDCALLSEKVRELCEILPDSQDPTKALYDWTIRCRDSGVKPSVARIVPFAWGYHLTATYSVSEPPPQTESVEGFIAPLREATQMRFPP
jgi:hypothetical protein